MNFRQREWQGWACQQFLAGRITDAELGLLLLYVSKTDYTTGTAWVDHESAAEMLGCQTRKVRTLLKSLRDKELLLPFRKASKGLSPVYRLAVAVAENAGELTGDERERSAFFHSAVKAQLGVKDEQGIYDETATEAENRRATIESARRIQRGKESLPHPELAEIDRRLADPAVNDREKSKLLRRARELDPKRARRK